MDPILYFIETSGIKGHDSGSMTGQWTYLVSSANSIAKRFNKNGPLTINVLKITEDNE